MLIRATYLYILMTVIHKSQLPILLGKVTNM